MKTISAYLFLIRLHRPLPIMLLIWPVLWALLIASNGKPSFELVGVFCLGGFLVRSLGVIINDLWDQRVDAQVERTQHRPLASGRLSQKQALSFGALLAFAAFCLVLTLNVFTIILAFVAIGLTMVYPLMKRITHFPQLVLGVTFNFGVLMAFSATVNHLPPVAFYLLAITIVWTLSYDTIYALADRKDDLAIGLRSTAVLFGNHSALMVALLQGLMLTLLTIFGVAMHYNAWFYASLAVCVLFFYGQHKRMGLGTIKAMIDAFSSNHWVGMVVWIGLVLQYVR